MAVIHPIYSESAAGIFLSSIRAESLKKRIERNKERILEDEKELKELEELGKKWAESEKEKQNEIYKYGQE